MGLKLYLGGSGSGKSTLIYKEIADRAQLEPKTSFLIIVPDQFTMQTQMDLVLASKHGGIMNIDVLSFSRLAHRIFDEVGGNEKPVLDDTGKSLILRKVAQEVKDQLPVLGSSLKKTGYIHEIKSALSEFMQYGIGVGEIKDLVKFSEKRGSLSYKLKDLSVLYEAFLSYIDTNYITTEETLTLLKNVLPKSNIIKNSVIVFDGFTGFTPIQNQVMKELLRVSKEVIVTVVIDVKESPFFMDGEQKLFYLSKKTVMSLCQLAKEAGVPIEEPVYMEKPPVARFCNNPSMSHLEQHLFRNSQISFGEQQDHIQIFEASTPREEMRQVCIKISDYIKQTGCCYRDIAVIAGDLASYANYVEEEFEKFSIPCYLDQTRGITLNPFIEYIRSALQIVIQNFSYESVFHYLRSGMADFTLEEVDLLENYVLAYGIRGKKAWNTMFVRKNHKMQMEELTELNEIRHRFVQQISPLLEKKEVTCEYVNHLYLFLTKNRSQEKLVQFETAFLEKGELVKAKEYSQIFRLVMDLLDQMYELIGQETMNMKEFSELLDAGFGEIQVGTIPQSIDRVLVGDMERTRLKQIKVLFFVGINDGSIPKNASKGGIISDIDREFLSQGEIELAPSPRQQMYIQRLYLYINLTKPSDHLFLSFAKVNGEGKSIRPSYLIGTIRKMFPEITVEKPEFMPEEDQIETMEDAKDYLVQMLRNYVDGRMEEDRDRFFQALLQLFFQKPEQTEWTKKMMDAAFYSYQDSLLGKEIANALYGQQLLSSVSRLEKYASCAYAHFLQYGISLEERSEYRFEDVDMGNIFHGVLQIFSEQLEKSDSTWFDFSNEIGETFIADALEQYVANYGDTVLLSTSRNEYMITRMKRILSRTVRTLQYQLQKGKFIPEHYELAFSSVDHLDSLNIALSEDEKMQLRGRIDRMDTYEDDNQIYVKVIDYKSGSKNFDLAAVYYGLQLQLVVYLNVAMELEHKKHPDKKIVPAAILYYQVTDPLIEVNGEVSEEEINNQIRKELCSTGIVNKEEDVVALLDTTHPEKSDVIPIEYKKDGTLSSRSNVMSEEELLTVSSFVNGKIKEIGKNIMEGGITLNPFEQGNRDACMYCSFKNVCGFDVKIPGFQKRKLGTLSKEELMPLVRKEAKLWTMQKGGQE